MGSGAETALDPRTRAEETERGFWSRRRRERRINGPVRPSSWSRLTFEASRIDSHSLRRDSSERPERLFDPRFDLADHQFHRAHRRRVRRVADLERKAHMYGLGRADLGDELFGNRLDIADQQIVVDGFERRFVWGRDIKQYRGLHGLLPAPEARAARRPLQR